jgi:uncharacterized protein (DUF1800 family)
VNIVTVIFSPQGLTGSGLGNNGKLTYRLVDWNVILYRNDWVEFKVVKPNQPQGNNPTTSGDNNKGTRGTWIFPLNRRDFLIRGAALGLTGSALAAFLQACTTSSPVKIVGDPIPHAAGAATPLPIPTSLQIPLTTPTVTALPIPTAIPTTIPTAIPTTIPTATPTTIPTPTPAPIGLDYIKGDVETLRLGHLLRRAGFGANAKEMAEYKKMGLDRTVEHLIKYENVDNSSLDKRLNQTDWNLDMPAELRQWWLLRMIYTQRPLEEKMTLFWHGILTSSRRKVGNGPWMKQQNQLLRQHALETYDVMLKAISRDPAMLIWLDSRKNRKKAPNENYSRELMELFSMGVGTFSELDVRESARAFTGWFVTKKKGFYFKSNEHDFGIKHFIGHSGDFDGDDIVDIILEQPSTSRYIAKRLFNFFVHDDPEPESIESLAKVFRNNKYSIKAMVEHILTSEEFYSKRAYCAKIKSPVELVAGAARTIGAETNAKPLRSVAAYLGQELLDPPDVAGWPGGISWINSTTVIQRANLANLLTNPGGNQNLDTRPAFSYSKRPTAQEALNHYLTLFLDGKMPMEEQRILHVYLGALGVNLPSDEMADKALRGLVYLLLASPDYQKS